MLAIRLVHVRHEVRSAQAALAQGMGAEIYSDAAGNDFAVATNQMTEEAISGPTHRDAQKLRLQSIPKGWKVIESDETGGWKPAA